MLSSSLPSADLRMEGGAIAPSFVLMSEASTIVADSISGSLDVAPGASAAGVVTACLAEAGDEDSLVVGAFPFERMQSPQLYRALSVRHAYSPRRPAERPVARGGAWRVTALPSVAQHAENIRRALSLLSEDDASGLRKVVLARSLLCQAPHPIDLSTILDRLRRDRSVTTFAVPLAAPGGSPRCLVGATPELLIGKRGERIRSLPHAGSAQRQGDDAVDRAAAEALHASFKDRREHAAVVEAILDNLAPYCSALKAGERDVASTATMLHLRTPIEGVLKDETVSVVELVEAVHPTPAVCGLPRERARTVIADLEPFDRGFYGGAVGWCDASGDGDWFVAIRCAEISGSRAQLYAGGGLVSGSDPDAELAEISAKFETLLGALGIDESGKPLERKP